MTSESIIHRAGGHGVHGMVTTGHPLASAAALDVLKDGGNAVDAALCASAVLSVVKSYHCGLGGDVSGFSIQRSSGACSFSMAADALQSCYGARLIQGAFRIAASRCDHPRRRRCVV